MKAQKICDYLMDDYGDMEVLVQNDETRKVLETLVGNKLGIKISSTESIYRSDVSKYKVASLFMTKYNKTLKKYKRCVNTYESSSSNQYADDDQKLVDLSESGLDYGTHYAMLGKHDYAVLYVNHPRDEKTDDHKISFEFYIIGKHHEKYKDEFFKIFEKYRSRNEKRKTQMIYDLKTGEYQVEKFKSFDKVIFKEKDKLIKYIDNWKNNIPVYYNKYKMIPKLSVLLYGTPGNGKTSTARAIADHLGLSTITSIPSNFFMDDGSVNRRRMYFPEESVLLIDEIDCICQSREKSSGKEIDERMKNDQILQNLLTFLDSPKTFYYKANDGIYYPVSIVVATTNYFENLDPAVIRPGRFDVRIQLTDFDKEQAEEMCSVYDLTLSDVIDEEITDDFTILPAKLEALCRENIDKSLKGDKLKNE